MIRPVKIAPSILAADFSDLRGALGICDKGNADYIHMDVMDNHFVPNLTIGPVVIRSIRPHTSKFLDVHLMVTNPEKLVHPFAKAGADGITFHVEASENPKKVIEFIRNHDLQVGVSLKPRTALTKLDPILELLDLVLIMSVEPGFGGQDYLPGSTERISKLHRRLKELGLHDRIMIEVDGGIKPDNAREVVAAGADILVAGSAIFNAEDPTRTIRELREKAKL